MAEQKKIAEAGARKAYFNRYIRAGKHMVEGYQGAPDKEKPMSIFGWELTDDLTDEDTPRPMWIKPFGIGAVADFTDERSKQYQYMTGMFLDYDAENDKPEQYLGRGCRVVIKHNAGKGNNSGRTFANMQGTRDYDGELPAISQEPVYFDFYNPTKESLDKLFPWEVEYLQEATDYAGSEVEALICDLPVTVEDVVEQF
jgi:hypothetical protein